MATIRDIESKRLAEQEKLDAPKTAAERNRWGQFATPQALALDIARYARRRWRNRSQPIRFLDPAVGTGSFYSALRQAFPAKEIAAAVGVELDKALADVASRLWGKDGLRTINADFTISEPPARKDRFNLVLTNPPYVRHHHMGRTQKERLQRRTANELGLTVSGLAGLYTYFVFLTDAWLADNALSIWLIPSELMEVNYGDSVKQYLTRHVTLLHIHRFCPSDVQFSDALVSSAIVIFTKRTPRQGHTVTFSFGGKLSRPEYSERVTIETLAHARKWTRYPGRGVQTSLEENHRSICLGDLFRIKRGLATGANNFFVLPRERARNLGIPHEFTKPILPSPRYLQDPVVESNRDGYPCIENPLSLIDCDLPEDQVKHRHLDFWSYLESGKSRRIHEGYLASRRTPWYSQENRPPAPFMCTYMGRIVNGRKPFRFIWNKSKATAANVYLLLYPRSLLAAALRTDHRLYRVVFDFLQNITPDMFLGESRVYGGGLYKLEPKELARISAEALRSKLTGVELYEQSPLFA